MELTSGTRTTAAAASVAGLVGLVVTFHGAVRDQLAHSLGGVCLTMIALTALILVAIRKWVTDTSLERTVLAATQREAQTERSRYVALQAALENEQGRLRQDMAAERAALTARLKSERAALAAEFDERRDSLIAETMEATVLLHINGKLAPGKPTAGTLIPFPNQQSQGGLERARSREHGVVGP